MSNTGTSNAKTRALQGLLLLRLLLNAALCTTSAMGGEIEGDAGDQTWAANSDNERELHQPIMLWVSGIPLHVVINPHSDPLAVGLEQCKDLLAQGAVNEEGLDLCSKEFARSLRPHVAELREVITVCPVSFARGRVSIRPLL